MQTYVKARIELKGLTPFVMNNVRLADPDDDIVKQIKAITSKRQITPEDLAIKEELQWRGSLYLSESGRLVLPTRNLLRGMLDAAKAFKLGASIERGGVAVTEAEVPFQHDGPDDLDKLWADKRYRLRNIVNGNPSAGRKGGKVPACRPIFPTWGAAMDAVVFTDVLGWDAFIKVLDAAGVQGIGNARALGNGKFTATAERL